MNIHGIEVNCKNKPLYDKDFIPFSKFTEEFEKSVETTGGKKIAIALYGNGETIYVSKISIHKDGFLDANRFYVERMVKFLLWMKGGWKVAICGDKSIAEFISDTYRKGGAREFDAEFMASIYNHPFEVVSLPYDDMPVSRETNMSVGGNLNGYRIGFDAGGSDRKVSAIIDGRTVFSEETVWNPKLNSDLNYHYSGIMESLKKAASYLPQVDAIGVSSAGIFFDNKCMIASLFLKVPKDVFEKEAKNIYQRAAREINPKAPVMVCNDGDVAALAGSMSLRKNSLLGIAMGTSEAAGFVDENGNIKGWLNELAFAPVNVGPKGTIDEWSGDIGCGVKYLSQDAVVKLCPIAGIDLQADATPAQKLRAVQELVEVGDGRAHRVFSSIGVYLGHGLAQYYKMYSMKQVLLLGRVMSGAGGNIILRTAEKVLKEEYPNIAENLKLNLPDEKSRLVGQSVAAASLPVLE